MQKVTCKAFGSLKHVNTLSLSPLRDTATRILGDKAHSTSPCTLSSSSEAPPCGLYPPPQKLQFAENRHAKAFRVSFKPLSAKILAQRHANSPM